MFGRLPLRDNQRVISHRGAGLLAPENTLSSITQARNLGFHNIHFDVHLTADGIPILSAQDTLNTLDDIKGSISEQFFDQINMCQHHSAAAISLQAQFVQSISVLEIAETSRQKESKRQRL